VSGMPVVYKCRKCGHILFESNEAVYPVSSVINRYGGKCPRCGNVLSFNIFEDLKVEGARRVVKR